MRTMNFISKEGKTLVSFELDDKTASVLYNAFYKHASNMITINGITYVNEPQIAKYDNYGELVLDIHLQAKADKVIYYNLDDDESWMANERKIPIKGEFLQHPLKKSIFIVLDVTKLSENLFVAKVCHY